MSDDQFFFYKFRSGITIHAITKPMQFLKKSIHNAKKNYEAQADL